MIDIIIADSGYCDERLQEQGILATIKHPKGGELAPEDKALNEVVKNPTHFILLLTFT